MKGVNGGNPASRSVPMTKGSSDVSSSQGDGAGTSTQVPSASVGGITLSPEQFEHFCKEVKTFVNEGLPRTPLGCAPSPPGTKGSGGEKKEHPERTISSQEQGKVDLQTAMMSSGFGKDELIAMVQEISNAASAVTQVPLGDLKSSSSSNPI